jgi:hypothetical protein
MDGVRGSMNVMTARVFVAVDELKIELRLIADKSSGHAAV